MSAPPRPHPGAAALACARRGWYVFPVTPRGKRPAFHREALCPRTGPCAGGHLKPEQRATLDPARIRRCWAHAPYNVGIACGPSGLVVLDLDKPKPGQHPPPAWDRPGITDGADVLAELAADAGQPFPFETFTVTTRRGGMHLYFTAPPGIRLGNTAGGSARSLGWLIDTRAHGGYVLAPGSFVDLPDGTGPYQVAYDVPPAPLPGWLRDRLSALHDPRTTRFPPGVPLSTAGPVSDLPGYVQAALQGEGQRVRAARAGTRNHTLNKAAYHLGQLVGAHALTYDTAYEALWQAVRVHLGPTENDVSPDEAHATITSGLTAGARNPRTITRRAS